MTAKYSPHALAATLAGQKTPDTRKAAEKWLTGLNVPLGDVWFLLPNGQWLAEKHVDDEVTIDETIDMAFRRLRARYALRQCPDGRWELRGGRKTTTKYRYYDTREAAEMVAIHNG